MESKHSGILTDEQISETSRVEEAADELHGESASDEISVTENEQTAAQEVQAEENKMPDPEETAAKRQFIIHVLAVILAVLGIVMLISGIALRKLDQESRKVPAREQMPQEYIDEFFSDENHKPSIEDYIEPEE